MNTELMFSSNTDQWSTPQDFYNELNKEFNFTLDPCADESNHKCNNYFTTNDNGLNQCWKGNTVFCNPPYSQLSEWIEKSFNEALNGSKVVMLIPARTDTIVFHKYILPYSGINSANIIYAYYAGLFDGEGCVRIHKKIPSENNRSVNPTYSLQVMIKMTDQKVIDSFKNVFGFGNIYVEKFENKKTTYRWECYTEDAKRVLELIYPYLKTKKTQAYKGIQFQINKEKKVGRKLSVEFLEMQEKLYKSIKELKATDDNICPNVEIRFVKGRLKFGDCKNSAPFPSMVVIF